MRRQKVATTVYLDPSQLADLRHLSVLRDQAVAELVREGIDLLIQEHLDEPDSRAAVLADFDRVVTRVRGALTNDRAPPFPGAPDV